MTHRRTRELKWFRSIATAIAACFAVVGCGGSEPAGQDRARRQTPTKKASNKSRAKHKRATLQAYPKVDEAHRARLRPPDFVPDPTGDRNRDPYRSYVTAPPPTVQSESNCAGRDAIAGGRALSDLRLEGIVMLGTKGYALFNDRSGYGHIAGRGDCLGREEQRIESISVGVVQLESASSKRSVALYPNEIPLDHR